MPQAFRFATVQMTQQSNFVHLEHSLRRKPKRPHELLTDVDWLMSWQKAMASTESRHCRRKLCPKQGDRKRCGAMIRRITASACPTTAIRSVGSLSPISLRESRPNQLCYRLSSVCPHVISSRKPLLTRVPNNLVRKK